MGGVEVEGGEVFGLGVIVVGISVDGEKGMERKDADGDVCIMVDARTVGWHCTTSISEH